MRILCTFFHHHSSVPGASQQLVVSVVSVVSHCFPIGSQISSAIGAQSDMVLTESLRELPVSAITEHITAVIELQQQSPPGVSQRAHDSKSHSSFDNVV